MKMQSVRFNTKESPEFFRELRMRVNNYFTENKVFSERKWNNGFQIHLYDLLILCSLGFLLSGFNNKHMGDVWNMDSDGFRNGRYRFCRLCMDANHGSYSEKRTINYLMGYLVNFLGAFPCKLDTST